MKNILITGGTGFISKALFTSLLSNNYKVRTTVRETAELEKLPVGITGLTTGNLVHVTDWKPFLDGVDVVVHLAAHVHHMQDDGSNSEETYQQINVKVTQALAETASKSGVKRFVFISSIKAMGEETEPHETWNESSPCKPQDAYGRSKYDAEQALTDISHKTGLEVVILRVPLVYGPNLKANMARLFRIVDRGLPLPLGKVKNTRSLLFVGNLVDAIRLSLDHPKAVGQTFLVSDGEDISSPELIRRIAHALNRPARLLPFPPSVLRWAGRLTGKSSMVDRLLNSLEIDSSMIRKELNWTPPFSMNQGLQETSAWFKKAKYL